MTSLVSVISATLLAHGAPSHPQAMDGNLSHVAAKGAFAPAEDRREAEGQAGCHFSPAKRTPGHQMESRDD